jgi:ligand-binding sensor domain-containing protein
VKSLKSFFAPCRLTLIISLVSLVLGALNSCFALDPSRSLDQYRLVRWDEEQGLPQTVLENMVQSRDGFIWLEWTRGIFRFDGKNFATGKEIHPNLELSNNVYGLVGGPSGELWFGSDSSLFCRLPNGEFKRFGIKDGLPDDACTALLVDSAGILWIGTTNHGLLQFKHGRFLTYPGSVELAKHTAGGISEARTAFWVGTQSGVYQINKASGEIRKFTQSDGLPAEEIYSGTTDREGRLWVGTRKGLARIGDDGRFHLVSNQIGSREIESLMTDSHGMIWAGGTSGGLWRIDPRTDQVSELPPQNGRTVQDIGPICEDREGNIWVSTNVGLERLSDVKFTTYTAHDGLSNDTITTVAAGASDRIWIGTMDGLACLTDGRIRLVLLATNAAAPEQRDVFSVHEDPNGVLWVGLSDTTLHRFDRGQDQLVTTLNKLEPVGPGWATAICSDPHGDLWVGTRGAGLQRFRDGRIVSTYSQKDGLKDPSIYSLAIDCDHRLWIGTRFGVDLLQDGRIQAVPGESAELRAKGVFSLCADPDGTLWAGTRTGLYRFRDGRWAPVAYEPDPRVLGPEFYCLLDDGHGNLWSSGSRGIFFLPKNELNEFFDGKRSSVNCRGFGKADGLKSADCNVGFPQACRSADGRLWFATTYGLATIDPNNLQFNSLPPPVQIEKVIVDLTDVFPVVAGSQAIQLKPGAHTLEFDYAGLSFTAPEKVRFRYRLEGFDHDWIDAATRHEAYYTNLAPGSYRFRVIACNNDGVWIPEQAAAATTLIVEPHFYQTIWFYALCAAAAILVVWMLWRWRLQQILEERTRLSRELHDTVARGSVGLVWRLEVTKSIAKQAHCESVYLSLDDATKLARENLRETRRAMRALRSGVLDTARSLPSVLETVLARTADGTQLRPELKVSGTPVQGRAGLGASTRQNCSGIPHQHTEIRASEAIPSGARLFSKRTSPSTSR